MLTYRTRRVDVERVDMGQILWQDTRNILARWTSVLQRAGLVNGILMSPSMDIKVSDVA